MTAYKSNNAAIFIGYASEKAIDKHAKEKTILQRRYMLINADVLLRNVNSLTSLLFVLGNVAIFFSLLQRIVFLEAYFLIRCYICYMAVVTCMYWGIGVVQVNRCCSSSQLVTPKEFHVDVEPYVYRHQARYKYPVWRILVFFFYFFKLFCSCFAMYFSLQLIHSEVLRIWLLYTLTFCH